MKKDNKYVLAFKNPWIIFDYFAKKGYCNWIPAKVMLKMLYKRKTGKELNLDNPMSFNEKLQWLSLYNRKPEFTMMCDKYKVRKYIEETIGNEYLNELLGVWDNANEIDFDSLPNEFVLKTNHGSGGVIICKDKTKLDINKTVKDLNKRLKLNPWYFYQEWPYKNIERKIIAERYLKQVINGNEGLIDYKFHCFNGNPEFLYVCREVYYTDDKKERLDFYDMDFNKIPVKRKGIDNFSEPMQKPDNFDEMVSIAKKLAANHEFIRVDLYSLNGKIYFGELTFKPTGGFAQFEPDEYDLKWGEMLDISSIKTR